MKYEFKKLFASPLMWIMLALTLGYMVFLPLREVWGNMGETHSSAKGYSKALEAAVSEGLTGDGLRERADALIFWGVEELQSDEDYVPQYSTTPMGDFIAMSRASDTLRYVERGFEAERAELVRGMIMQNVSERQKSRPDSYLIAANEKAISIYNRRIALEPVSTGTDESTRYSIFNYSMWEYVMLALCVLMTVRLISLEYRSGAYRLVNTSRRTVQSLYWRKYLTVTLTSTAVLMIQAVFELVFCMTVFGLDNLRQPIQQITMFEMCPYHLSIAGFYVIKLMLRLLLYITVISITAAVTVLVRRPLISVIISLVLAAGGLLANMVCYVMVHNSQQKRLGVLAVYNRLREMLPQSLLNIKEYLISFDHFSLFGMPVSRLVVCVAVSEVITAGCAFLGYFASGKIRRSV